MPSSGQPLSHFTILAPLGKGGMGQVFLAEDTILDRKVALKFLSENALEDPVARRRFLREARSAAALDNPFICQIYETGEADGEPFIAMEYVEGESLAERLQRQPLAYEDAIKVGCEVCEALEVAHENGIIHRDLKPANIMLSSKGHAKVMDFGLAKQVAFGGEVDPEGETAATDHLTATGTAIGTLAYMSPEQLRAEPLKPSSDVFSFGVVLFELLTGRHPFNRPSTAETIKAIMLDPPATLEIEDESLPAELEPILQKALAKEPDKRYQTGGELVADFRRVCATLGQAPVPRSRLRIAVGAVAAAVVVLVLAILAFRDHAPVEVGSPEPVTVLIADFDNRTGDEVFEGALEQALAIGLEEAPFISSFRRGRARQVAQQIHGGESSLDTETARLVARREAIGVVIHGTVELADPGFRVTVQALDALTGESIVDQATEVESRDEILPAMARLTVRLRRALGDTIPESLELVAEETFTTASLEAARAYAQAQDLMAVGKWQEAAPVYRHAIQLDSDFGRAFAGLAVCFLNLNQLEDARKYYEEAFARIDRMTDREKYRTRGGYYLLTRNFEKAAEEYEALVREFPSDPAGPSNLAFAYFYGRNMPSALEIGREAAETHPENVLTRANLALYAMYASDFETAAREAEIVFEMNPSYETAYVAAAMALIDRADFEGARGIYDRLRGVSPWGASLAATGAADLALYQGRIDEAVSILEKGIAGDRANELDAEVARKLMMLAGARMTLGDEAGAIAAADEALSLSQRRNIVFAAAGILIEAGRAGRALELSQDLTRQIEPEPRVCAKLIEGRAQLDAEPQRALEFFGQAQDLIDCWLGRYLLGRAYLAAEAYTEAYSEFENCIKRRGEATSLHLDDVPSYYLFPEVFYYLGLAQEGLGSPAAKESYRRFLEIKEDADGDPLVADARRHLEAL